MFMTPTDITSQYQPLAADREEAWRGEDYNHGDYEMENDEELWGRKRTEAQLSPEEYHEQRYGEPPEMSALDYESVAERTSYPQQPLSATTSAYDEWEYKEGEYLERKGEEKIREYNTKWSGPSLYESVRQQGVQKPVHLGQQFGDVDKPQIVGGHHRIISARDTRPNQLIPVIHHESIAAAQSPPKRMGESDLEWRNKGVEWRKKNPYGYD